MQAVNRGKYQRYLLITNGIYDNIFLYILSMNCAIPVV